MAQKLECGTCGYKWSRPASEADKHECVKCQTPLDSTNSRNSGEVSTFKQSAGSAMESESGKCKKNAGGPHMWKFGKCSNCGVGEGKMIAKSGAVSNPGGKGECAKGGKCMFQFSRCKKCGVSELSGEKAKGDKSSDAKPRRRRSSVQAPADTLGVAEAAGLSSPPARVASAGRRASPPVKAPPVAEVLAALAAVDVPMTVELSPGGSCLVTITGDEARAKAAGAGAGSTVAGVLSKAAAEGNALGAQAGFKLTGFVVDVTGKQASKFCFEKA